MMSDERTTAAAITALNQHLTHHRMRKTAERYTILERVMATSGHFSADDLHQALENDGYHVSRATVYNTIELLVNAGIVRRHTFGTASAKFEALTGISNHHHLVCSHCGKIKEIKDAEIDALLSTKRFSGFNPAYADLYIYGLCGRCSRKKTKTAEKTNRKQTISKK